MKNYRDLKIETPFEDLEGLAFCKPFFAKAKVLCLLRILDGLRLLSNSATMYFVTINNLWNQKFINLTKVRGLSFN